MSFEGAEPFSGPAIDKSARCDERRRIARELHDSTSQLLVALELQFGQLRRLGLPQLEPMLDEMEQLIRDIHESIRCVASRQSGEVRTIDDARVRIAKAFLSIGKHEGAGI